MAVIITVHGTFASGPDTGSDWWQIGSDFERDLRDYVDSEDGQLCFLPHGWDGENSESSRRVAGLALFTRLKELELRNEKYCLVGHSHGGSVIAAALVACASSRFACSGLSRWITVGTPFISRRRRSLLFTRLGLVAKALYLTVFSVALFLTVLIALQGPDLAPGTEDSLLYNVASLVLVAFSPLIAAHAVLWFLDLRRTRWYATTDSRMTLLADRWLSLRHPADEAIGGLRAVSHFAFPIIGRRFIVEPLTSAAGLLSPILVIGLVWIFLLPAYAFSAQGYPLYVFVVGMIGLFAGALGLTFDLKNLLAHVVLFLVAFPAILFMLSLVLIVAIRYVALGISGFASNLLNRLVWREIRRNSYGDDTPDAMSLGVDDRPAWAQTAQPELPRELALELESHAARASAASVLKLRVAVQELVFRGDDPKSRVIAEYLSWDELIHTSYFKATSFRKLVAFVISRSSGFRASEKLKNDPEYAMMARWYEQTGRT